MGASQGKACLFHSDQTYLPRTEYLPPLWNWDPLGPRAVHAPSVGNFLRARKKLGSPSPHQRDSRVVENKAHGSGNQPGGILIQVLSLTFCVTLAVYLPNLPVLGFFI